LKVGVSSLFLIGKPFETVIDSIKKIDVGTWELVDEDTLRLDKRRVQLLNEQRRSLELSFTVHCPFADMNIATFNTDLRKVTLKRLFKSIEYASLLDAKSWICHPGARTALSYPGKDWRSNLKTIEILSRRGEDLGTRVIVENMPNPFPFLMKTVRDFEKFYSDFQDEAPDIAFDIGHANTSNQVIEFLDKWRHKIVHIHAHDNDGRSDEHNAIGHGTVNWQSVASRLSRLSYDGSVIVESIEKVGESLSKIRQLSL
jgi:sugar phosphate isomerase/epimerase